MTAVQGTNDSSVISKCSMISKGYIQDEFLKYFVKKKIPRTSLINRGYYIRVKCIQHILYEFLQIHFSGNYQIVSFGAGFDSSYFNLKSNSKLSRCLYIEIDFPEVMIKKFKCIQNNPFLDKLLSRKKYINNNEIVLFTDDYILIGADLQNIQNLDFICKEIGISYLVPTLFLSECAIVYMDTNSSDSLIHWSSNKFPNSAFITYEQVCPNDGFGIVMQKHFASIGSPLKALTKYESIMSQQKRYQSLGWNSCYVFTMNDFYNNLPYDEKARIKTLEIFDEYEEWHLKCSHYVLICACQGVLLSLLYSSQKITSNNQLIAYGNSIRWNFLPICTHLQRFGHKSVLIENQLIAVIGGFGHKKGKHLRLNDLVLYDLKSGNHLCYDVHFNGIPQSIMHTSLECLSCNCLIILGGRFSPLKTQSEVLYINPKVNSDISQTEFCMHDTKVLWTKCKFELQDQNQSCNIKKFFCKSISTVGCKPCDRWRHTATLVSLNDIDHIVIFGGCNLQNEIMNDCFILSIKTQTWKQIKNCEYFPAPRHSHSAVAWNSKVIISGGLGHEDQPLNSVFILDLETESWMKLQLSDLLPRYSHTSHIWKEKLILLGGVNTFSGFSPGVAIVNLLTLMVREMRLPIQDPENPIILHKHSSELIEETQEIVILGGGGNCFSFGTHLNSRPIVIPLQQFI